MKCLFCDGENLCGGNGTFKWSPQESSSGNGNKVKPIDVTGDDAPVFVLRNILKIPREQLGPLSIVGRIGVCDLCKDEAAKVQEIFQQLVEIQNKFEKGKMKLLEIIKRNAITEANITEQCRRIVGDRISSFEPAIESSLQHPESSITSALVDEDLNTTLTHPSDVREESVSDSPPHDDPLLCTDVDLEMSADDDDHQPFHEDLVEAVDEFVEDLQDPLEKEEEEGEKPDVEMADKVDVKDEEPAWEMSNDDECATEKVECDFGPPPPPTVPNGTPEPQGKVVTLISFPVNHKIGQPMPLVALRNERLRFSCTLCLESQPTFTFTDFTSHIFIKHQFPFKCVRCPARFKPILDHEILSHFVRRHNPEQFEIPIKSMVTKEAPMLPQIPWFCPGCSKIFQTESLRDTHTESHCLSFKLLKFERFFKCVTCAKSYVFAEEVDLHTVLEHPGLVRQTEYRCISCLQCFGSKDVLKHHQLQFHSEPPLKLAQPPGMPCTEQTKKPAKTTPNPFRKKDPQTIAKQPSRPRRKRTSQKIPQTSTDVPATSTPPILDCTRLEAPEATAAEQTEQPNFVSTKPPRKKWKICCRTCDKTFGKKKLVSMYRKGLQEGLKWLPCDQCGNVVRQRERLKTYLLKRYGLDLSEPKSETPPRAQRIRVPRKKNGFPCPSCGKIFDVRSELSAHCKRTHRSLSLCSICGENRKAIELHMAICHRIYCDRYPESLRCSNCGAFCKTKRHKDAHVCGVSEHRIPKKVQVCTTCGKLFANRSTLLTHVRSVHEAKYSVNCDICQVRLQSRRALENHKASIHNIGKEKCDVEGCGRVFTRSWLLEKHLKKIHFEQERNEMCAKCGRAFMDAGGLRRHMQAMHENKETRPYKCNIPECQKGFATAHYLYGHKKSHRKSAKK